MCASDGYRIIRSAGARKTVVSEIGGTGVAEGAGFPAGGPDHMKGTIVIDDGWIACQAFVTPVRSGEHHLAIVEGLELQAE